MAKPIKETPFLSGKDARNFVDENKSVEKISEKEKKQIEESYQELISIAEFKS